jgi:signal transduction histidine kinase/ligand-binding sensor domain-containing protein/DNA-binding response OmpR family regulator
MQESSYKRIYALITNTAYWLLTIFFLGISEINLQAQGTESNQKFISYSTRLGLSSSSQTCIVQDKEGFIWIGTTDGLSRFDGYSFKVYRKIPGDSTSLNDNLICTLYVDSKGTLWIGAAHGGLCRYNRDFDNFTNYTCDWNKGNTISNDVVSCIVEDKKHRLWVGTNYGLNVFEPDKNLFTRFFPETTNKKNTLAFTQVRTLAIDNETLWIGYQAGTFSSLNISKLKFKHYSLLKNENINTADYFVNSLCLDGNYLWISTWGKGIWVFNKKAETITPCSNVTYSFVNSICKDKKDNIWVGTESDGLVLLNRKREKVAQFIHDDYNNYSISNNCVSSIFVDLQNNLWLGSKNGTLHYFQVDNPFQYWIRNPNNPKQLSNDNVTCMLESGDHKLWVGYHDGGIDIINLLTQNKKYLDGFHNNNGLGYGTIITMFEDENSEIWIGTYLNGLKKYDKNSDKFITYKHIENDPYSISGNDVRRIAEDSKGNMWLAIHGGGLNKFDKKTGKAEHFRVNYSDIPKSPITTDWLLTVVCDKKDNIWVGSVSGASFISNDFKTIKHFINNVKDNHSLSNDIVNVIYDDSKGNIWLGTDDGLDRYNKQTNNFKVFSTNDGLPDNLILGILEDNHCNLWISTNRGLSEFISKNEKFKNYSIDDGMVTDEFNVGSCFKNKKGDMYLGGLEGLNMFNPDSIKINELPPPVYITDFKLFNNSVLIRKRNKNVPFALEKPINKCKEITLRYDQNVFGFEFVALNYTNLHKNLYTYKLEGFDKSWSKPGTKRDVTYTNLPAGTYTFKVMACNSDGIWSKRAATIQITIKPPYWKTNWALIIYIFLILLLLYVFRMLILRDSNIKRKLEFEILEVEKLQEMDSQKMRFFSNISHEFRTPLTLIIGPLEKLIKTTKDEFQQVDLKLIHRNAQRLLRLINQLMDFKKIETSGLEINFVKDDIAKFIKDLSNAFVYEAKQRNIIFNIYTQTEPCIVYFDRDKIDKILYNLISNAFKFTPNDGKITITIKADEKNATLFITIDDSGIGIPIDAQAKIFDRFYQVENTGIYGTGIGLALTKELVQLLRGNIKIESTPSEGSRFIVSLPILSDTEISNAGKVKIEKSIVEADDNPIWSYQDIHAIEHINTKDNPTFPLLLIVEDNIDMRLYIQNEFIDSYRIIEANNGVEGFERAIAEIPDIIISDVMMPKMDGVEFCKKIKSEEKTSHIPVLLLTARSSDEYTIEGFESGADDYITKPFNAPILKIKIRNIVESRKFIQSRFIKEPNATINEIAPSVLDEKFLKKAYDVVEKHISNANFEANDFAVAVGMSRAQVYRKISAITGQSVKEFIRIIRLKKAADMLLKNEKNITEIAFEVGFNSIAYFTKSFTDYYGVSPSKYVAQNK